MSPVVAPSEVVAIVSAVSFKEALGLVEILRAVELADVYRIIEGGDFPVSGSSWRVSEFSSDDWCRI